MVGAAYRRFRRHLLDPRFHACAAGPLVAATCVLISRLSSFQPGYLYGVIASLAFQGTLPKNSRGTPRPSAPSPAWRWRSPPG